MITRGFSPPLKSVILALFLFVSCLMTSGTYPEEQFATEELTLTTSDNQVHTFLVEIADTEAKRELGLMFRKQMDERRGMLFVFEQKQRVRMWMKNTFLPLDMVFLDQDLQIQSIVENAVPLSETIIDSVNKVDFVLELRAGTVQRLGMKTGDKGRRLSLQPAQKK